MVLNGGLHLGVKKTNVSTPNKVAKDFVNKDNSYIDPLTNEVKNYDGKLSADHIFPKKEIVELDGCDTLAKRVKVIF